MRNFCLPSQLNVDYEYECDRSTASMGMLSLGINRSHWSGKPALHHGTHNCGNQTFLLTRKQGIPKRGITLACMGNGKWSYGRILSHAFYRISLPSHELFHNFIDFKKAFGRVSHEGLWRVLKQYNIDNRLIEVISSLCDEATSAVLLNGNIGDVFRTTIGVRERCPLSHVVVNIFLENLMQKKLTPHCRQCPSEDYCFAACGLLTISILWKTAKKNCNNSPKGWRKQLLNLAWK